MLALVAHAHLLIILIVGNKDSSESEPDVTADVETEDEEDPDSTKRPSTPSSQRRRKRGYAQKFKTEWKSKYKYEWLTSKEDKAYCSLCKRSIQGGIAHVNRHSESTYHHKREKPREKQPKLKSIITASKLKNSTQIATLKLLMYIVEHNLPFRNLEYLPKLIQSVAEDSEIVKSIKCGRTKATAFVTKHLARESLEECCEIMKRQRFSLMIDETTDVSTSKCLAIVVRYFEKESMKTRDRFLGLIRVTDSTAAGIFDSLISFFDTNGIPLENMIGFAGDNCDVMMGSKSGVQARLKEKLPNLFVLGCIYHSMHLCSYAACLKLPSSMEDLARDVYSYFKNSSKRIEELGQFQSFLNLKPHKILKVSQTRWLSLEGVVNRILEQWPALELFFTRAALEDNLQSAKTILNALKNPLYKVYYAFLSYVLGIVNKINLIFQGRKPVVADILTISEKFFRQILNSYMQKEYLQRAPASKIDTKHPRNFLDIECIYYGAKCELLFDKLNKADLRSFKLRALEFYVELATEIQKRIPFHDKMLKSVTLMTPKAAVEAVDGTLKSLMTVVKFFSHIIEEKEYEDINSEYRLLPEFRERLESSLDDAEKFWAEVSKIKLDGKCPFSNLLKLSEYILVLPHSSAATERIFSDLNNIKSKLRSRLHVETCEALLLAKELFNGKVCFTWSPRSSLLSRVSRGLRECDTTGDHDNVVEIF